MTAPKGSCVACGHTEWNPDCFNCSRPCPACEGGQVPLGEHFVTRDMALDAGDPLLEGTSMGIEYGDCRRCDGAGRVDLIRTPTRRHRTRSELDHQHERAYRRFKGPGATY